jgi:hypothetical protein
VERADEEEKTKKQKRRHNTADPLEELVAKPSEHQPKRGEGANDV